MATVTRNKLALFQWLDNKDLHVVQGALNLTNHAGTASQNHSSLDLILIHGGVRLALARQAEKYMYITDVPARVCRFHSGPASATLHYSEKWWWGEEEHAFSCTAGHGDGRWKCDR